MSETDPSRDPWVDGAIELVRRSCPTPAVIPPLRVHAAPRRRRFRWAMLTATLACAASALALVAYRKDDLRLPDSTALPDPASRALTYEVVTGIHLPGPEPTIVAASESALLRFSDGSTAALGRSARGRVRGLHAHGARLAVDAGRADVDVVHADKTAWVVEAGPYTIRVIGTRFSVDWRQDSGVFDLRMRAGTVEVVGPFIDGAKVVRAGERFSIRAFDGRLDPPSLHAAPSVIRRGRGQAPVDHSSAPASLTAYNAKGDYSGAIAFAEAQGVADVLRRSSQHELAALADAARYTRRAGLAVDALDAIRRRWPRTPVAADAAFALGRLAEDVQDDRAAAIRWYERSILEQPNGRYASESLGRKMTARRAASGDQAARPDAEAYLSRHPQGSYAGVARQILGHP